MWPSLPRVPRETGTVVALVSGSHFVNHMYLVLLPPIFAILAGEFGVGLVALGAAMGVQAVVNTAFQLPYGYLADNHSRTLALSLCLSFGALGAAVTALAPTYAFLLLGQAILGLGIAGHHSVHYSLMADATPRDGRGRAFSVHGFAGTMGFAASPAFVTAVIALSGLSWRHAVGAIAAVGALYAVVAVAVMVRYLDDDLTHPPTAERSGRPLRDHLREEARSLVSSRPVLAIALLTAVMSTTNWGVWSYAVVALTDGYGLSLSTANLGLTAMFVAGGIMMLVGGDLADRIAAGPVLVGSYSAMTVLVVAFGSLALPPLLAVVVVVMIGGARSPSSPARSKLLDGFADRGDLGKSFATLTVGIMIGNAFAPPFFGALIDHAGLRVAFAAIAAFALLALALMVVIVRRYAGGFSVRPAPTGGAD